MPEDASGYLECPACGQRMLKGNREIGIGHYLKFIPPGPCPVTDKFHKDAEITVNAWWAKRYIRCRIKDVHWSDYANKLTMEVYPLEGNPHIRHINAEDVL
jgi:hypothetical protein